METIVVSKVNHRQPALNVKDHQALTKLLDQVLDAYKADEISRKAVVNGLQHMFAAVDKAYVSQIEGWIHQDDLEHFRGLEG